jgi:hypothetical protein
VVQCSHQEAEVFFLWDVAVNYDLVPVIFDFIAIIIELRCWHTCKLCSFLSFVFRSQMFSCSFFLLNQSNFAADRFNNVTTEIATEVFV